MARGKRHVVILAGGRGMRFWPWSRRSRPKPLLDLDGCGTLLEQAWRRARTIAPDSRIWVVVPRDLVAAVRTAIPRLRSDQVIIEPILRDTAPAVALACAHIADRDAEAVVLVQPSDHAVDDAASWTRAARRALAAADRGGLVCLGVTPRGPSSAYGYLVLGRLPGSATAPVRRFVEKPSPAAAKTLLRGRRCLWNAGVFAWRVTNFLEELERQRPDILLAGRQALAGRSVRWRRLRPISVDRAVLEGARDVRAVALRSGWDDLGSWDVVARRLAPASRRRALLIDSPRSAALVQDRWVAILGVPDVVVVESPDAVLVVARSKAQDVRRVVSALRRCGRADLE